MDARVQLPAGVHQIDATGYTWTFLDQAEDPNQIQVGRIVVAGDPDEPFQAQVVDIVDGNSGRRIVHLELPADGPV